MIKARLLTIAALSLLLCACGGPSVRFKKDVSKLLDAQKYSEAEVKITENKSKIYGKHNELLYYLDRSTPLTDSYQNERSNEVLSAAQDAIEALQVQSITQNIGTLIINDNTQPYRAPVFEQALTYFYRAMNFLTADDIISAAVEARKAVFFLDNVRENKKDGYNDDPFIQYFASMVFEDMGRRSDARIARTNALNAYERYKSWLDAKEPDFPLPQNYADMGEAVVFHYNGKIPLKISKSFMFAWNDIWFAVQDNNDLKGVDQTLINSVYAGAFGRSITVSFPEYIDNPYEIASSSIILDGGQTISTQPVADLAQTARKTLEQQRAAAYTRTIIRAVTKYILSVQARHSVTKLTNDETWGDIAGSVMSIFSNVTEKADTRSWFTLPAQIRMAAVFLPEGRHTIKIICTDKGGKTIDEHLFENVQINKGKRTYLYYRTAK